MLEPLVGSQLLVGMATIATHVTPEVSSTRVKLGAAIFAIAGTIIKISGILDLPRDVPRLPLVVYTAPCFPMAQFFLLGPKAKPRNPVGTHRPRRTRETWEANRYNVILPTAHSFF